MSWLARLQHRRWLKDKALQDYRNSRGSAHYALLTQAAHRLEKRIDAHKQTLEQHKLALRKATDKRDSILNQTLSRHIVETYLTLVDGIGPVLKDRILTQVFHNKLKDLQFASQIISGIGDNKQLGIDAWINVFEKKFPLMLQEEFPGKTKIMQKYEVSIKRLGAEIGKVEITRNALCEVLQSVQTAIEQLSSVTEKDFYQALLSPDKVSPSLERYRLGVFAPWEPVPEWFKLAMDENWEG